jgi:hypothetical protein
MSPQKPPTPEALATQEVKSYLAALGWGRFVKRQQVGQHTVPLASPHPWAPKGRVIRYGDNGAADLRVELPMADSRIPAALQGRDLFLEVKKLGWKPPKIGTKAWKHYAEQVDYLAGKIARGNAGYFVTSAHDVFRLLVGLGFTGIPEPRMPQVRPKALRRPKAAGCAP